MLSRKALRNIQAFVVLAGSIAAWILVPGDILMPLAWVTLGVAVAVCFGMRAYMRKLHAASKLSGEDEFFYTEVAMAFGILGIAAFLMLIIEYS